MTFWKRERQLLGERLRLAEPVRDRRLVRGRRREGLAASSRRVSSETSPCSRSSSSTTSYWSGCETAATCAKFFAAARSIDGPPTSIISTDLRLGRAAPSGDRRERIEVDADEVERLDLVLGERLRCPRQVAPGEDARVDARVQRLDAAAEHLGRLASPPRRVVTSRPCSSRNAAVPPDETSSKPSSASPRANSSMPVLS